MKRKHHLIPLILYYLIRSIIGKKEPNFAHYNLKMIKIILKKLFCLDKSEVIVAYTSHNIRIAKSTRTVYSILNGKYKNVHIVLTLYKEDTHYLTGEIKRLIDAGIIELIIADTDLGPHLKYFYVMQKYRDLPIITIDDDNIYYNDHVSILMSYHQEYPNTIIARRCFMLEEENGTLVRYNDLLYEFSPLDYPSHRNFATGIGGILYPPNILEISDEMIPEILAMKYDDDVVLKVFEIRKGIKIYATNAKLHKYKPMKDEDVVGIGLWVNGNKEKTHNNIMKYEKEFLWAARDGK